MVLARSVKWSWGCSKRSRVWGSCLLLLACVVGWASPEPISYQSAQSCGSLAAYSCYVPLHHFESRTASSRRRSLGVEGMRGSAKAKSSRSPKREQAKIRNPSRDRMGIPKAVPRDGGAASLTLGHSAFSGLPPAGRPFTVLGIETSCDDTAVAVLRSDGAILGEAIAKQGDVHQPWGGIVPSLARKAHEEAVNETIMLALERAFGEGAGPEKVDVVAATVGPGMEICLRVGATAGRAAAIEHSKPFLGIHHLEAHCLIARAPAIMREGPSVPATPDSGGVPDTAVDFPFLALVISGGHCLILRVLGVGEHEIMGGTLDDTLGEAYDKCARLLDLPVGGGGGPAVELLAKAGDPSQIKLPVPMQGKPGCDFSFSGLKQALRQAHRKLRQERDLPLEVQVDRQERTAEMEENHIRGFNLDGAEGAERVFPLLECDKANLAAAFQESSVRHLEDRVGRAMESCGDEINTLVVVGGVAANQAITGRLRTLCENGGKTKGGVAKAWNLQVPKPSLCTDNGVMIAWTAIERVALGLSDDPSQNFTRPEWPIGELRRSQLLMKHH